MYRLAAKERLMKRLPLLVLMLCAALQVGNSLPPSGNAQTPHKESAVVEFNDQVKLLDVFLRGRYLIVHDHEKMAGGEDCTYVYSLKEGQPDRLVTSFHCTPVARAKAESFTVRTSRRSTQGMVPEVLEIQFAGSSEAHQVPLGRG
jgi:hypothetical protein